MRTRTLLITTLGCAALALPGAASAATITEAGGTLVFRTGAGETHSGSLQAGQDASTITFYTGAGTAEVTSAPPACEVFDHGAVTCPTPAAVRYELGDGDDRYATSFDLPKGLRVHVDGGAGADWLQGHDLDETLLGGDGADRVEGSTGDDVVDGGAGDDKVEGYSGRDRVSGGAGNDVLYPDGYEEPAADVVDGGPGIDTIESDYVTRDPDALQPQVAITLGGGADDGRPGEGDDLRGIERLVLSSPGGRVAGSDAAEYVKLHQVGENGELIGNGGDDELRAGDGADRVDGGAGDDELDGGFGDDTIVGGPGRDRISADLAGGDCGPLWCKYPYGNDVVEARDGETDSIACGAGEDRVLADPGDAVAPDCEQVERSGGESGPQDQRPVVETVARTGGASLRYATPTKLGAALRKGLEVSVAGVARGTKVVAKAGRRTVASGRTNAKGIATLRFTKAAKRRLARKRSVKLTILAGGARETLTLTR
ncbi:MAG TPA: calcium-binding protein [Solirubrobacteraceae bacterium]|nr:calcium-binding protein [Solirubrobacteraceae bacterium]